MIKLGQPSENLQSEAGDVHILCQPLLKRVIPAAVQSLPPTTTSGGSAAMVSSQMMTFCARHPGAVLLHFCT